MRSARASISGSGNFRHARSEEHTSELQSQSNLVCRLLLEKKKPCILLLTPPPRHSKYCIAPSDELLSLKRTKGVKPDVVPNTCKAPTGPFYPMQTPPVHLE